MIVKRTAIGTWSDGFVHAGNLAYVTSFAVFPFLIFCLSLVPLFPERIRGVQLKPTPADVRQFIDAALVTGEDRDEAVNKADAEPEELLGDVTIPFAPTTQEAEATTQPADVRAAGRYLDRLSEQRFGRYGLGAADVDQVRRRFATWPR